VKTNFKIDQSTNAKTSTKQIQKQTEQLQNSKKLTSDREPGSGHAQNKHENTQKNKHVHATSQRNTNIQDRTKYNWTN
jgi:hypothetical protein